ncbi:MAG: transcription-repair coupling factor [Bacteroidales bacterium]|nr:transcription-repair coupling factor [Bacteroidales bacterium]
MEIRELCDIFNSTARRAALKKVLTAKRNRVVSADGLAGSSPAMLLARLPRLEAPYLVIANDLDEAGYIYNDLIQINGEGSTLIFPSGYKRDIKYGQIDAPSEILRTEVLNQWYGNPQLRCVVTYPEALAEKVAAKEVIDDSTISLSVGEEVDLIATGGRLRDFGFQMVDYVYEPGQFSIRGSILDVYSYSNELPYRIDFFGDEIDSIRTFNVETQLSEERLKSISILNNNAEAASQGTSLLGYIQPETWIMCRNAEWVTSRVKAISEESMSASALIAENCDSHAMEKIVDSAQFIVDFGNFRRLEFHAAESQDSANARINFAFSPQGIYHKNFDLISTSLQDFIAKGYKIYILSDSEKQTARLRVIFDDRGDNIPFTAVKGTVHEGFVDDELKMCIFTDHQIFDRFHRYNLKSDRARSGKLALSLKELNQIEVGDYIVHEDHGIGKFGGLVRNRANGTLQETIKLIYQNGDIIFCSIHALHKLSKYRGKEGVEPKLSRLGGGAWNKIKNRTKSKLKDIARDLIKLYAKRREAKGFAYSPDGYLQQELEASFIYEDTPDQLKATQAVKADMERDRPMDRLVCGDVGFGKTEVAIRAAFKAATDGKQVAVLVPTTVLAFQHYNTFSDRLKDFPVRVDYLTRARKPKEVKQLLADLAEGKIDILIGTHKLIGKTVKFRDLGLLIIDEEQKFGVSVKEKLKEIKTNIDTLTMSATPIPRTLQFSLMGARDLSAITTPPANRYPILTSVKPLDDDIVSEAINFELSRNGQVFFVNNRIDQLPVLENMIHRLVPDARVVVGHGQMSPEELEKRIIDFTNHDYDVLLATTIIESGIDMPNVNTIIINNAQNHGLSDLHQLRGRVGRSNRKAFCYLTIPPERPLTPVAMRRLNAIESFSDLGSGIQIAMQDLDIRGAGNLLGAEQSGFIADLGYETYQKILKEAVLELKTQEFADTFEEQEAEESQISGHEVAYVNDCNIDTDLELLFPATYVPQESERITLYRELDSMETDKEVEEFEARMRDRFGPIPEIAAELIRIVPLRRIARTLGVEKIALKQGSLYLYFVGKENAAYYHSNAFGRCLTYLQSDPLRCKLREVNDRCSFLIANVKTVSDALALLKHIAAMQAG